MRCVVIQRCVLVIVGRWILGGWLALWLAASGLAMGQTLPVPELSGWVVDEAQVLTTAQRQALGQMLQQFEQHKGAQIFVLTIPALGVEVLRSVDRRVGLGCECHTVEGF